ncbi:MAG: 5-(carboxyamino)imidazole ribonucleotide synthase [Rhodospirillaceae bacterium]|nr:5-(carboxyamino)imidazole ribonucleotide synthase [Rhodospirillaceae bacterium]
MSSTDLLAPGAVIGILGGGQLGRMTALAAAAMGYRCHIFCPDADAPASQVTDRTTLADYGDRDALDAFARAVDVVTYEFENIPCDTVAHLAGQVPVHPGPGALAVCQDRLAEKVFVNCLGIGTADFRVVPDPSVLPALVEQLEGPCVLKANTMGYDGKGQALIRHPHEADDAWLAVGARLCVLEKFVAFECEVSVIAARDRTGRVVCYPAVENRHENHILKHTLAPAPDFEDRQEAAQAIAVRLIEGLDMVGVLAVEMFATTDGRLLVNELAPRPHNSGHWTIEGCRVSQFTNLVRALVGLPVADPGVRGRAEMVNLLGAEADEWAALAADPGASVHLYGKAAARPGRKMGHVTRLLT